MITSLSIENFALIDKLSIDFSNGFSIITGETGAGKSILLGALGLALGKRADLSVLRNKDEKCVVEAHFKIDGYRLEKFFEENDLDYDASTIIRREILPSGKTRAFINDSPVNLQELQELGNYLIDIHSQHETRELSDGDFQFRIIDSLAGNIPLVLKYADLLHQYKFTENALKQMHETLHNAQKAHDYNNFLLEELLAARLSDGQQELLEATLDRLNNVEAIRESIDKAVLLANDDQYGILNHLKEFKSLLQKIGPYATQYQFLSERAQSVAIEFDDIVAELSAISENLFGDPATLETTNLQLQIIYNLQKKHHVTTIAELLTIQDDLDSKALEASSLENDIAKACLKIAEIALTLDSAAAEISTKRVKAVPILTEKLVNILQSLGMPDARFKIELRAIEHYARNGKDELEFLFSANKGAGFGPLKKVASGGEMSRIMLAVKSILAQYSELPSIIFDEIDTGVSGEIANKMGEIMKGMSGSMQVFAITHLPQIAAKGAQHFKVFKYVSDGRTESKLQRLSAEERVVEIAQMLSGSTLSDSAINHAKALLA